MKLLIVDDNKYVVTLLRRQLNWEAFGIEELIGVYSVEEAKEALRSTEIDFLISDIEMPVENGFDLLEWIRSQELSPEVVLLTSYADFSYAKKAIKYGCFDYLLKPVARQDLEEVVRKLVIKRIEDKKQLRLQQFGNNWISHQNLIKEMFWRDVIGDDTASNPERIAEKIRKEQMPYEMDQKFVPILICMEEEREGFGRELLSFTCENVLSEIAAGGKPKLEFLSYNGYAQFASVFRAGDALQEEQFLEMAEQFVETFSQFYHRGVACYVGKPCTIAEVGRKIRKLEEIFFNNISPESGVFRESDFDERKEMVYNAPEIDEWRALISERRQDLLEQKVHRYFDSVKLAKTIDSGFLNAVLADWSMMTVNLLKECNLTTYQALDRIRSKELEEQAKVSVSGLEKLILTEAGLLEDQISYAAKEDRIIADIKAYVKLHLEDVTRSRIAGEFYLSPGYVSKIFRKETGLSMSEYIQKTRMQEARKLLAHSDLSISEIAEQVGYPSFAHFSKQFKKMNGMTPNEYRKTEKGEK